MSYEKGDIPLPKYGVLYTKIQVIKQIPIVPGKIDDTSEFEFSEEAADLFTGRGFFPFLCLPPLICRNLKNVCVLKGGDSIVYLFYNTTTMVVNAENKEKSIDECDRIVDSMVGGSASTNSAANRYHINILHARVQRSWKH